MAQLLSSFNCLLPCWTAVSPQRLQRTLSTLPSLPSGGTSQTTRKAWLSWPRHGFGSVQLLPARTWWSLSQRKNSAGLLVVPGGECETVPTLFRPLVKNIDHDPMPHESAAKICWNNISNDVICWNSRHTSRSNNYIYIYIITWPSPTISNTHERAKLQTRVTRANDFFRLQLLHFFHHRSGDSDRGPSLSENLSFHRI